MVALFCLTLLSVGSLCLFAQDDVNVIQEARDASEKIKVEGRFWRAAAISTDTTSAFNDTTWTKTTIGDTSTVTDLTTQVTPTVTDSTTQDTSTVTASMLVSSSTDASSSTIVTTTATESVTDVVSTSATHSPTSVSDCGPQPATPTSGSCPPNYIRLGHGTLSCLPNGTWSGSICQPKSCDKYADHFLAVNNYVLNGYNLLSFSGSDVLGCISSCISQSQKCVSAELKSNRQCFNNYESAITLPRAYDPSTTYTYFHRLCSDCAPGSQADIVFILDSSGSISASNYQKMLTFVQDISNKFDVGQEKIRIGAEIFSDGPSIQFNLNKYNDNNQVMAAIGKTAYIGRATNTSLALEEAGNKMFTTANGDRPAVPNIAVVITDGWSNYPTKTVSAAKDLRDKGVTIFAVGVGSGTDQYELRAIADDPDNVMQVENFNSLEKIVAHFATKTCAKTGKNNQGIDQKPTANTAEARHLPLNRSTGKVSNPL